MRFEDLVTELNKGDLTIHKGATDWSFIPKFNISPLLLNRSLYGGLPLEGIIEVMGLEGCGKTTLCLDIIANFQKLQSLKEKKKNMVYVDVENSLSEEWAKTLSVNLDDNFYVYRPRDQAAETILQRILDMIATDEVGIVILDSIPVMYSMHEEEITLEDTTKVGGLSMILQRFCNRLRPLVKKHHVLFVAINQQRDKIGALHPTYITPGGHAWKFACDLRIELKAGSPLDANGKELAKSTEIAFNSHIIKYYIVKNKISKDDRKRGQFVLDYNLGIRKSWELLRFLYSLSMVHQKGTEHFIDDPVTKKREPNTPVFPSREALLEYMDKNPEYYDAYLKLCC